MVDNFTQLILLWTWTHRHIWESAWCCEAFWEAYTCKKYIYKTKSEVWKQLLDNKNILPAPFVKLYDTGGSTTVTVSRSVCV